MFRPKTLTLKHASRGSDTMPTAPLEMPSLGLLNPPVPRSATLPKASLPKATTTPALNSLPNATIERLMPTLPRTASDFLRDSMPLFAYQYSPARFCSHLAFLLSAYQYTLVGKQHLAFLLFAYQNTPARPCLLMSSLCGGVFNESVDVDQPWI